MSERAKPFVAWMVRAEKGFTAFSGPEYPGTGAEVPVVVTPLLPDDPKPGEVWIDDGEEATILGPVTVDRECAAWVETSTGICLVSDLRRPPVLKKFRVSGSIGHIYTGAIDVQAESKEAALKLLAATMEEVTS